MVPSINVCLIAVLLINIYTINPLVMTRRTAFKMFLKPGFKDEYQRRHSAIWPELAKLIKSTGVYDYSIFLDEETNILFAVQKQDGDQSSQDLGDNPIVKKWWDYMADIMETNADNSPVSIPLDEVFYLE
jgi:L-rhamnose mutarotase